MAFTSACEVRGGTNRRLVRFLLATVIIIAWFVCFTAIALADTGEASYYGTESGARTANGEYFDGESATCAHRSLPFGALLEVTNLANKRKARCRVNDRGPAKRTHRILDVSRAVASKLGMLRAGVASVRFRIVGEAVSR